jgi:TIR- and PNP-associating SLOG family
MKINGRRVCIAGSASLAADPALLKYAHELVARLVAELTSQGGLVLCGAGKNPRLRDDLDQPPVIFDWTILETVLSQVKHGGINGDGPQGRLLTIVATSKTISQIPQDKKFTWDEITSSSCLTVHYVEPGWTSGAIRRQQQANLSDILVLVSGGEGVEHLAREFAAQGKPIIPLNLNLGSSTEDGTGGAVRLFGEMRNRPADFVRATRPETVGTLLTRMETAAGATPIAQVVSAVLELISGLVPPSAFYVRLLDPNVPEYGVVEDYFRRIVDPVVSDFGYHPVEMGKTDATSPWMNAQIFESIHYSAVTIVDLTGVRPNCFMELGYAFGRNRKVIIIAREGTAIPFDPKPIEIRFWNDLTDDAKRIDELRDYWKRTINRGPLVQPKRVI